MSEEEKKAFSRLYMKATLYSADTEDYPNSIVSKRDLVIIINLIEKQQKEIENLLQDYKQDEKIIQEMAEYIRNIKTDYEQDYCNIENCNYHKTNCSNKCIIDYFRKRCKQ